jgi:sirohydrochlorin ferrochelatase
VKTAVIILGHGSRSGGGDATIKQVAAAVMMRGGCEIVEHAFLQHVRPTSEEALDRCVRQGAEKIVIVPFFMQPGAHVTKDIPAFLAKARKQHPTLDIKVTDFVGAHPLMTDIVLDLVRKTQ